MNDTNDDINRVKLGKRLTCLEMMVDENYEHIWDCCCDHGLLGFRLLENLKVKHLHFVDIVPSLLTEIETKLTLFYSGEARCFVHCLDVAKLPLNKFKQQNEKHLIIIAGVGGKLIIEFLSSLLPVTEGLNVEFILSPVHHNYQLRNYLRNQRCKLIDEIIIEENKRFYELMHISPEYIDHHEGSLISLTGNKMWDFDNSRHQVYLQQTINHYQRMKKNPNVDVSKIIKAYQDLKPCV